MRGPEELSGGAATTRDVRSSEEVVSNEPAVSASGVPGVSVQPLFTPTNATHQVWPLLLPLLCVAHACSSDSAA